MKRITAILTAVILLLITATSGTAAAAPADQQTPSGIPYADIAALRENFQCEI